MTAGDLSSLGGTPLAVTTAVRHAEVDGLRVLLDLRTEAYRVLDDVASAMWSALVEDTDLPGACAGLAERYEVGHDRIAADLAAFARRCLDEGLLAPVGSEHASSPPGAVPRAFGGLPLTARALLSLIATRRALKRDGFRATYERYSRFPRVSRRCGANALLPAFVRAENVFVARRAPDDCLARSLSLFRYLRSHDVPAEHVIGVRRVPFGAHAWVECDGEPALETRSPAFKPIARIGHAPAEPPR